MPKRNLKQRLTTLLQQHHLLSAAEIIDHLKKSGDAFNKTSVYRALDQLLAVGIVCRHYFSLNQAKYELRDHHHAHLVCNNCGYIEASECNCQEPLVLGNFKVDHHHTTLFGICASCRS